VDIKSRDYAVKSSLVYACNFQQRESTVLFSESRATTEVRYSRYECTVSICLEDSSVIAVRLLVDSLECARAYMCMFYMPLEILKATEGTWAYCASIVFAKIMMHSF
jgi:hypothetical protein